MSLKELNSRVKRLQRVSKITERRQLEREVEELIASLSDEELTRILIDADYPDGLYRGEKILQ